MLRSRRFWSRFGLCLAVGGLSFVVVAAPAACSAQEPAAPVAEAEAGSQEKLESDFIRIRQSESGAPLAMQTAVVRYVRSDGQGGEVAVDLIGVVHIGEKEYYEELNKSFSQYDALLYELVAPEGTRVERGMERGGPVSGLQNGMKDMLGLEFQLEHIDYHQANFVHADMSPEEFVESMEKNDESFMKMFFKMMGASMAQQGAAGGMSEGDLFAAMFSSNPEMKLRRTMARQLAGADIAMIAFSGRDGSTIIHHRNAKCFEILDREIAAGKRKVGVFYGAGHLGDMEKRLIDRGFTREGDPKWMVAWKLTDDEEQLRSLESDETTESTEAAIEGTEVDGSEGTVIRQGSPRRGNGGWFRRRRR